MEEQDTATKLKARIGEWQSYVQQPSAIPVIPKRAAPTPSDPDMFAWDTATAEKPAPAPPAGLPATGDARTNGNGANPEGSLVSRVVKYEAQIAELQAALESNRPDGGPRPLDTLLTDQTLASFQDEPLPNPTLTIIEEPTVIPEAQIDLTPGLATEDSRANLVLWILFAILVVGIGGLFAITRIY